MTTIKIEELVDWAEPKRVQTKHGPRDLRKAPATPEFWDVWRAAKAQLKEAGVSCSKNGSGWEVLWWQPISEEEKQQMKAAKAASRASSADIDIPAPNGLEYLPYQRAGVAYALDRKNVLIGDEMGLGKTIQAIGVWNSDPSIKRTLVICPASLRLNWKREFKKWATRKIRIEVIKGGKAASWPVSPETVDVLIINPDVLKQHKHRIMKLEWDLLIADEAHYFKTPTSRRTKALLGYRPRPTEKADPESPIQAKRKLFLTGTPIENRPVEIWPLVQAIDPMGLGSSYWKFTQKYCAGHRTQYGYDVTGASNTDQLQDLLRERFMVRRLKSDVLKELPPKTSQIMEIPANGDTDLVAEEKQIYEGYREFIEGLEQKLRQAEMEAAAELEGYACTFDEDELNDIRRQLGKAKKTLFEETAKTRKKIGLAKVPHVIEHLENAFEQGAGPILLHAYHIDVQDQYKAHFGDRARVMNGSTPLEDRQQMIDDFQAGKFELFISNIREGYTVTRSSLVVIAEEEWNPSRLNQFVDRTHRIGQENPVLVQHLVFEDSLDIEMLTMTVSKQQVIDAVLDNETEQEEVENGPDEIEYEAQPDKLEQAGKTFTAEQIEAIHRGLRHLAAVCDGAVELDGQGFNRFDSRFGTALAEQGHLTAKQAAIGQKMVIKYQRQLDAALVAAAKGE